MYKTRIVVTYTIVISVYLFPSVSTTESKTHCVLKMTGILDFDCILLDYY